MALDINNIPITRMTQSYPFIAKACLLIALDNGRVNRQEPIGMWAGNFSHWLESFRPTGPTGVREADLLAINEWIAGLTEEHLDVLCADHDNPAYWGLSQAAPRGVMDLLGSYYAFDR